MSGDAICWVYEYVYIVTAGLCGHVCDTVGMWVYWVYEYVYDVLGTWLCI